MLTLREDNFKVFQLFHGVSVKIQDNYVEKTHCPKCYWMKINIYQNFQISEKKLLAQTTFSEALPKVNMSTAMTFYHNRPDFSSLS